MSTQSRPGKAMNEQRNRVNNNVNGLGVLSRPWFCFVCFIMISGLFCLVAAECSANTFYVSPSGSHAFPYSSWLTASTSIQPAVSAATNNDTVLVSDGTYLVSSNIGIMNGVLVKSINGSSATIVDGNQVSRCFYLAHSNAVIDGFTILNGKADDGGGVYLREYGTVQNCLIISNSAPEGGGIFFYYGGLVQNCTVAYNLATTTNVIPSGNFFVGGGAYCYNGGTIQNCTIMNNAATSENCPSGTSYYCSGGGVYSWHAGLIQNCYLGGNRAVAENTAEGGGVYLHEGSLLQNCVVYSNKAVAAGSANPSGAGGGVYIDLDGDVENCTIVRNRAFGTYSSKGSGIFTFRIGNNIRNTIVYFNVGGNIDNDGTNVQYTYVCSTPLPGGTGNIIGDPTFIDLNSGNCHLQAGSICIDTGTTNDAPILDLDCISRPLDGNGDGMAITDIGAYEYTTNPLSAPTGVYASPGLYRNKNRVVWNAVSGASVYEVWRGTSDNAIGSTRIANTVTDTGYDDTAVMQSQTYYYWVKAKTSTFSSSGIGFVNNYVAGDFDGDGSADPGVFLAARGEWILWLSSASYARCGPFFSLCYSVKDIPVPADFDGDGKTDPAVYHRDSGDWYVWFSGAGYTRGGPYNFRVSTADVPVPEDFDGDGKADPAVFVSESGDWYVWFSSAGYVRGGPYNLYVTAIDAPAPADFDGDGKADPAVFVTISGDWYIWFSSTGYARSGPYNLYVGSDDTPIAADFDNDGKADPAIYQNTEQSWYIWFSSAGYARGGPYQL